MLGLLGSGYGLGLLGLCLCGVSGGGVSGGGVSGGKGDGVVVDVGLGVVAIDGLEDDFTGAVE